MAPYYMAFDWFFLGQDFAVLTVSMETAISRQIDPFRCIRIQRKTIDLSTRL